MNTQELTIRNATAQDMAFVKAHMDSHWGGEPLVIRGEFFYPTRLPGLIASRASKIEGLLFYEIKNQECEIIVFEVFDKFKGLGTQMLDHLKQVAIEKQCQRIFLQTTNDNLDALRFYQKREFKIYTISVGALELTRQLKPSCSTIGDYGIPCRDEIYLEYILV